MLLRIGRYGQYLIIMLHNRFKLIQNPATITIDPHPQQESDIDEDDHPNPFPVWNQLQNNKKRTTPSLLNSVNLRGRRQPTKQIMTKEQAIDVDEGNQDEILMNGEDNASESESLVFVQKNTNPECLKRKLRRLATVPNIVKLERRDQNTKECSICLTDLKELDEKQVGRLNCKHIFCYACILQSSKFSNRCPYCRASFSAIRHGKRTTHVPEARLNEQFDDPEDEPCYICGRNDDFQRLLQCEYCEYAYCHTYCDTRLNSDQPPVGHWYCLSCQELLRNQINIMSEDEVFEEDAIFEDES